MMTAHCCWPSSYCILLLRCLYPCRLGQILSGLCGCGYPTTVCAVTNLLDSQYLHEFNRQSRPCRPGFHSWVQQTQQALDRVSVLCNHAWMKNSCWNPVCYVSPETNGSVCCRLAEIHPSRWRSSSTLRRYPQVTEDRIRELVHALIKQIKFVRSVIALC